MSRFAIFVLSHERAGSIKTIETLEKLGCKKDVYVVVDDGDNELEKYKRKHTNLLIFNKKEIDCDTMVNWEEWKTPLFARNYILDYAKENKIDYAMMIDDDITNIKIRAENGGSLKSYNIKDFDKIIEETVEYMEKCKNIAVLGTGWQALYVGGLNGVYEKRVRRDVSQVFICDVKKCPKFRGIMNEDYIMSVDCAINKNVAMSMFIIMHMSPNRMSNKGGLNETYEKLGVYQRDFYTMIAHPSIGKIQSNLSLKRKAENAFPMIISERFKK